MSAPAVKAPGTLGMVNAHNREMTLSSVDLSLPSPRMPLVFERFYLGQDHFEGPFGPGWDTPYNQRITEVPAGSVPVGSKMLIVYRGSDDYDTAAKAGDVLLHTGDGRVLLYKRAPGTAAPAEYAGDALLTSKTAWLGQTIWYLPPPGIFDALVRFGESGEFFRLTPDGTEYRYDTSGRLTRVQDRYETNRHDVIRNADGELRLIRDRSIEGTERSFTVGYYRVASDPSLDARYDKVEPTSASRNKVARIVDSSGREVTYLYDAEGQLETVEGVEVKNNPGGFTGSRTRSYHWGTDHTIVAVLGADPNAAPLLAVTTSGDGVLTHATGGDGTVTMSAAHNNTAEEFVGGTAETTFTTQDGVLARLRFNPYALLKKQTLSKGAVTEDSDIDYVTSGPDKDALIESVWRPRRNRTLFTYGDPSPNLRSRGNVTQLDDHPALGGSGGVLTRTMSYDPRYNQPAGGQDPAGRPILMSLADEGRSVGGIDYGSGAAETFTRNAKGQLASHGSVEGVGANWSYDSANGYVSDASLGPPASGPGTLTTSFNYSGCTGGDVVGAPCNVTPPSGAPMALDYAEDGTPVSYARSAHSVEMPFDRNNRPIHETTRFSDGTTRTSHSDPNQVGFERTAVVDNLETFDSSANQTWSATPDARNRVESTSTPDGKVTTYTRDVRGRVLTISEADHLEEIQYDVNGNPTVFKMGGEVQETRTYTGHDQLETVTDRYGTVTTYSYNNLTGELIGVHTEDPSYGTLSNVSGVAFDALGRPTAWNNGGDAPYGVSYPAGGGRATQVTGPLGKQTTVTTDEAGRPASASVGAGAVTLSSLQLQYTEGQNRVVQSSLVEGQQGHDFGGTTTFDEQGNLQSVENNVGGRTQYTSRSDGALTSRTVFPDTGQGLTTSYPVSRLGESLGQVSPGGVTTKVELDPARRLSAEGRPGALRRYGYDAAERLNQVQEPDGATWSMQNFDGRDQPQQILMPGGGNIAAQYDLLGRRTGHTVTFGGFIETETFGFDGFDRVRAAQNAAAALSIGYTVRGVLAQITVQRGAQSYPVSMPPNPDDTPAGITYPSNVQVHDIRDAFGQLTAKQEGTGPFIISDASNFAMTNVPGEMVFGNGVTRTDTYDARRRLIARKYTKAGVTIADLRYAYDLADREMAVQSLHKGGRVDLFGYDKQQRLRTVEVDARPALSSETSPTPWAVTASISGSWRAGRYRRAYGFEAGTDVMTSANTQVAPSLSAPPFAGAQSNIDLFGFAGTVEVGGAPSTRSRDALGNVTLTPLEDGDATLKFDGFSRLREVDRADTAVITYGYRPDGMLVSRVVVCNNAPGCMASNRTFVYAGLLLLEEYEGTALAARYFYGDGSDIPIAADLFDANLGALRRVYYATDRMGSIVGVMDNAGALIERVSYDPYGRPTIEAGDADPPQVSSVQREANGDLLVAFTEAVLPPPSTTAGTTIVPTLSSLSGAVTLLKDVSGTMTAVAGTWSYEEAATGFDHGTVLRFVPGESLAAGSAAALSVNAGGLIDSWSNAASAVTLNFNIGAGVLYTGPPQRSTSTPVVERSLVGNGLLFQAHLWDADAGLYLARARVLDPTTGTFLQRDPSGYSDSVNLYAFAASDPINHRDPTGRLAWMGLLWCAGSPVCRGAVGAGVGAIAGAALSIIRQTAQSIDDPALLEERGRFSWSQVGRDALLGAGLGGFALGSGNLTVMSGMAAAGAGLGTVSAINEAKEGHPFTAAFDFGSAVLAGWASRSLSTPEPAPTRRGQLEFPFMQEQPVRPVTPLAAEPATPTPSAVPGQQLQLPFRAPEAPATPSGPYIPADPSGKPVPLPQQVVEGVDIPLPHPSAEGPHTTLGGRTGGDGSVYRQSATFPQATWPKAAGKDVPWSRTDWTSHGRGFDHPNPHQHVFQWDPVQKRWVMGPPRKQ